MKDELRCHPTRGSYQTMKRKSEKKGRWRKKYGKKKKLRTSNEGAEEEGESFECNKVQAIGIHITIYFGTLFHFFFLSFSY